MQPAPKPRLLDLVHAEIRKRHYRYRTEKQYVRWIVRFIEFHDGRHPKTLGGPAVEAFLSRLATTKDVAAATQAQALAAVLLLYEHVLQVVPPWLGNVTRAAASLPAARSIDGHACARLRSPCASSSSPRR